MHSFWTLFGITIIACFSLCTDQSLAAQQTPSHRPNHQINFFIPHTITVFLFSSSPPDPQFNHHLSTGYDLLLLPPPSSTPSKRTPMPLSLLAQFMQHPSIRQKERSSHRNQLLLTMDNGNDFNNDTFCKIPRAENDMKETKSTITVHIDRNIEILNKFYKEVSAKANDYVIESIELATEFAQNTYFEARDIFNELTTVDVPSYSIKETVDESIKQLYDAITITIRYGSECKQFMPILSNILPSRLSSIAVQQICGILMIGSTIFIALLSMFIVTYFWYKSTINQYLQQTEF